MNFNSEICQKINSSNYKKLEAATFVLIDSIELIRNDANRYLLVNHLASKVDDYFQRHEQIYNKLCNPNTTDVDSDLLEAEIQKISSDILETSSRIVEILSPIEAYARA